MVRYLVGLLENETVDESVEMTVDDLVDWLVVSKVE
jgi:hypothetical protein